MVVEEGVKLVEERHLGGQAPVKQFLPVTVLAHDAVRNNTQALQNTDSIGVDNEGRLAGSIDQDIVGRLRADAVDGQQLPAQWSGILDKHPVQIAAIMLQDVGGEGLELGGLGVEIARGPDDFRQFLLGTGRDGREGPAVRGFEVGQGQFHVLPGSGLGEDGPNYHIKGTVAGPPMPGPVGIVKPAVDLDKMRRRREISINGH